MTIHHISLGTNDLDRARTFYDPVLEVVGLRRLGEDANGIHYGTATYLFSLILPVDGAPATIGHGVHVAFGTEHREEVERFHRTALAHGGTSDGAPGIRPDYDANYFAAFVRDPDGNKLEAVTYSAA